MATPPGPLLFVPLDDRPATRETVLDLARAAGVEVRTPPLELLGDRYRAADLEALWAWIDTEAARSSPVACIAAVEMLCFGGLVASRKSVRPWRALLPWLDRVQALAARIPTYLGAVVLRTPVAGGGEEDPAYWEEYGEALHAYMAAVDAFRAAGPEAYGAVQEAADRLPGSVVDALLRQRQRHLLVAVELLAAAARGRLRALLVGQDDATPRSLSRQDREVLERLARALEARTAAVTTGADELGARLFARWLNEATGEAPRVRVLYTAPGAAGLVPRYESVPLARTVLEHVATCGCRPVEGDEDILLWVHNVAGPEQQEAMGQDGQPDVAGEWAPEDAAAADQVRGAVREERVVALADVRFANGADRRLVERLLTERAFAGIVAYAGWNTASNTLGSALAQAVVVYHLRRSTVNGSDRAARRMLLARLLDDWGYQAVVRPALRALALEQGVSPSHLADGRPTLEAAALRLFREQVAPPLARTFGAPVEVQGVRFPWNRLFEAAVDFSLGGTGPQPRPPVVVDYDPRWPALFESERALLADALAALHPAPRIEHVGSTAVPGLAAKPVLDIMIGVARLEDLDRLVEPLGRLGYEYVPELEVSMPNRRYFRRNNARGERVAQVHAVVVGSPFWQRYLRFRDYLRAHPEEAAAYARLKRELAAGHVTTHSDTFAKSVFIREVEARAEREVPG
ncbi:MAG: DUF4127 family protein [Armatimonadota bacterium]|nr:DUF4127 family protein [Armatimonadota bacterium]MDR7448723.1 DUF4127 family protein [Armatimonadota bacterium]MDR7460257.1 DUF4127 family protein [Armatimonadota bacterium]MDR7479061.1 DUF4127 family protein [Armatimonadota bacterium]MDR7488663.1 DUF4127 family protein [Armatimonadota bacterium]